MKLSEYNPHGAIQALIFGRFKTGKTWGAGTFPRPVFMSFDPGGINTLFNPEFVRQHGFRGDIEFEFFTDKNKDNRGIVRSANAFDDACKYYDRMMAKDRVNTFDTFVIDSGTTLSEAAMNKAVVLLGGPQLAMTSKTHTQAINTGLLHPKMQDYGAERSMVEQFVDMVKGSGKNVLFLCHEKEITDDDGNVRSVVPLLTGKSVESIPLKFDEVWNLQVRKKGPVTERVLVTTQTPILKVGSRLGIPDGTPFEYSAINKVLTSITEERTAMKQPSPSQSMEK